jgi:hypothetical protein
MINSYSNKVAFIVVSCDKYNDLWDIFFKTFFKFWNDCPYKIYLASNFDKFHHQRVTNISFGEDKDYSTNLINILKNVSEEWMIVWYEDAFLTKKVPNKLVESLVNEAITKKVDYLKLTVDYPLYYGKQSERIGPIPRGVKYRSAMGMALYHKSTLEKILVPGQSAWQLDKSTTADALDIEFYALGSNYRFIRPFTIINSVIKGKWYMTAPRFLKKEGMSNYISNRSVQPLKDFLYIKLYLLRVEIYFIFKKYWYS